MAGVKRDARRAEDFVHLPSGVTTMNTLREVSLSFAFLEA